MYVFLFHLLQFKKKNKDTTLYAFSSFKAKQLLILGIKCVQIFDGECNSILSADTKYRHLG